MKIGYVVFGKTSEGQLVIGQLASAITEGQGGGTIKTHPQQEPIAVTEFHRVRDSRLVGEVTEFVGLEVTGESFLNPQTPPPSEFVDETTTDEEEYEEEEEDEDLYS